MDRESLRRFFDKFNPDAKGKVSHSEIFATFRTRTGANLTDTTTSNVFTEVGVNHNIADRRRSGLIRVQVGLSDQASNSAVGENRSTCTSGAGHAIGTSKTASARKSRNGPRIGKSDYPIDFYDVYAAVEEAQDPRAINDEDAFDGPMEEGDTSQVEARTPPAMERNLFLSALANGKLAYHRDDLLVTLKRIIAGGLAGMIAKTVVAPVDRIKILFQVTNEKFSFRKAARILQNIVTLEGPAGLWKGNSATMIRVFPYAGTQFMIFDTVKRWLLLQRSRGDPSAPQRLSNFESLMSGSIAGAISALVTYPLDMARARLAVSRTETVHGRRRSMGVREVLRSVVREDGFRALYRGVTPSLLGIMPYAGIAFSINEHAKYEMIVLTGREPSTLHKLGIGAFAGLVAQSCTYPLEVMRRRMQTHGMVDTHASVREALGMGKGSATNSSRLVHTGFLQTLTVICREQGVRGLFKGLSVNWVKGPVAISISFTTFDFLKRRLDIS